MLARRRRAGACRRARGRACRSSSAASSRSTDGPQLVCLATSRAGYGGTRAADHAGPPRRAEGQLSARARRPRGRGSRTASSSGCRVRSRRPAEGRSGSRERFAGRLWLAVELAGRGRRPRAARSALTALGARALGMPAVACGDVHMHQRRRRALQDVLTAIRLKTTVARGGPCAVPERRAHPAPARAARGAVSAGAARGDARDRRALPLLARRAALRISGGDRAGGQDARAHLRRLIEEGAARRWPAGTPPRVRGS